MKRVLLLLTFLLCMGGWRATQAQYLGGASLTAAATSDAACTPTSCLDTHPNQDSANVAITVSAASAFVATLQFEVSQNGTDFSPVTAFPPNSSTGVTTVTGAGIWTAPVPAMTILRIRCTLYTSGTAVVSVSGSKGASIYSPFGGGGGGGTVTAVTGTSPIVSSGGATPAISCPTCNTSSATVTSVSCVTGCTVANPTTTPAITVTNGGTVTSVTGTANQIDVATGTTTPVLSLDPMLIAPGSITATTSVAATTTLSAGATPPTACSPATGCVALSEATTAGTPTASVDYIRANGTLHSFECSLNGGAETACVPTIPNTAVSGHLVTWGTWPALADGGAVPSGQVQTGTLGEPAVYTATGTTVGPTPVSIDASVQAGADEGAKIIAAYGALPAAGGTIDARGLSGAQTFASSGDVLSQLISKPVNLLLGASTITVPTTQTDLNNQLVVNGLGPNSTVVQYTGSGAIAAVIQVGNSSTATVGQIGNLRIIGNNHSTSDFLLRNSYGGQYPNLVFSDSITNCVLIQFAVITLFTNPGCGAFVTTTPTNGYNLSSDMTLGPSTTSTFINPNVGAGSGAGFYCQNSANNQIIGGTSEGNAGDGLYLGTTCDNMVVDGTDFEANGNLDIENHSTNGPVLNAVTWTTRKDYSGNSVENRTGQVLAVSASGIGVCLAESQASGTNLNQWCLKTNNFVNNSDLFFTNAGTAYIWFCPPGEIVVGSAEQCNDGTAEIKSPLFTAGLSGTAGLYVAYNNTATTSWGSAATTSNTILGPATVPTNGHLLGCTTSGIACTLTDEGAVPSGQAAAPNLNAIYASPNCGTQTNCYPVLDDVQYAFSVTCNGTTTITTASTDPPFVAGDVGKIIVGNSAITTSQAANCPPQGTITTFTNSHSVVVSNAATATVSATGGLAWGHDDGAALATAYAAALGKGCLYLPQGAMFFSVAPFLDTRTNAIGPTDCVMGTGATLLTPLPSFNYSACVAGASFSCVFNAGQPVNQNQNPAYSNISNLEVFSMSWNLTGTGTSDNIMDIQRTNLYNVWLWGWGSGVGSGFLFNGPDDLFSPIADNAGATACSVAGSGASTAGANNTVQMSGAYCGQTPSSALSIGVGAALDSSNGQYGPTSGLPTVNDFGLWHSTGEVVFGASSGDTIRANGAANVTIDSGWVIGAAGNIYGALDCAVTGGNLYFRNTTADGGGSSGLSLRSVAGCNMFDQGGNTVLRASNSLSGNWFGSASITGTTQTTGNIVLSGLGSGASVSAASGNSQAEQFTFTIGTGPGANGTATVTFPTPFIVAPTCGALQTGGTSTTILPVTTGTPTTTGVTITYFGTFVTGTVITRLTCSN
jgi:hypothetical protein